MKILLLSPNQISRYNWGHQLFRNEIGRQCEVIYYGKGYPGYSENDASKLVDIHKPDILLTYGFRYTLDFKNIGSVKIPKAHIVIDLFPANGRYKGNIEKYKNFVNTNKYDMFLYRQRCQHEYLELFEKTSKKIWLPFSVDTNVYKKESSGKSFDVLTSSTQRVDVYPNRRKINKIISKMNLKVMAKRVVNQSYVNAINKSKICIISTNIFNSPNMKFTEFTSTGSFTLADKPADFDELGFIDGSHLVLYSDLNDMKNKIEYYLQHKKERNKIAECGMNFVRETHSNEIRVRQMLDEIKRLL